MAIQGAAHENRLCVRAPLGIGHSDWGTQVHTKVATEMLIRRRLNTLKKLVEEYELTMVLVPSNKNMANGLTRVPQRWFTAIKMENGPKPLIGALHIERRPNHGHPQKQWTSRSAAYHSLDKENLPSDT